MKIARKASTLWSIFWRSMCSCTRRSLTSSLSVVIGRDSKKVRAYSSVCSSPGTSASSYDLHVDAALSYCRKYAKSAVRMSRKTLILLSMCVAGYPDQLLDLGIVLNAIVME